METLSTDSQDGRRQGSSSQSLPFGYSVESIQNAPYDPPPAPAPGPALLDDTDSHYLDNFFHSMDSNHLGNNDFLFGENTHQGNAGDLNFDWPAADLPPVFAGSTTSLPQPSTISHGLPLGGDQMLGLSQAEDDSTTSPEVLAAASMLYQNGHTNGNGTSPVYQHESVFSNILNVQNRQNSHPSVLGLSNGFSNRTTPLSRRASYLSGNEHPLQGMYYDTPHQTPQPDTRLHPGAGLKWGSDSSFVGQNFMAPPTQETEADVTHTMLQSMECLEPQDSANNTRPASPNILRHDSGQKITKGYNTRDSSKSKNGDDLGVPEDDRRPRKKIRTKAESKDDESDGYEASTSKTKKGKGNTKTRPLPSTADSPSKRRKSQGAGGKPVRENLTEAQKRSNHILSEQKRRNLIKQGFEDLCELVPDLRGGGYSKSAILTTAADYLDNILKGNEELKSQLAGLKAGDEKGSYG